jgi:phosphate:Na+ symporter
MSGSLVLLHLGGAVALLLWATRMVRTGVERGFGSALREHARKVLRNPLLAAISGIILAIAFQSATAVGLIVSGFAAQSLVTVTSGIIAMLGADLGSAIAVRLLSFDLGNLVPALLLAGTAIFMSVTHRVWQQAGRILVGIGLLLLSLRLIGEASEPLRDSSLLPVIVDHFRNDYATTFIVAAIAAWLFHSSVAAVLLIASLAGKGLVPPEVGIIMMLGANFGGAMIATALTRNGPPEQRAVILGNLALRGFGALLAALIVSQWPPHLTRLAAGPALQIVHAHIAFNTLLLLIGLPLAPLISRFAKRIAQAGAAQNPNGAALEETSALDEKALDTPALALANATREVLRLSELVEGMLTRVIDLFRTVSKDDIETLTAFDDKIDRRHNDIKLYLARATTRKLSEPEAMRCQELVGACVKLEQVGDIITRNMLVHIQKKRDRHLEFTEAGWLELAAMHASVLANARLAFNVIVSRDQDIACQLVMEKDKLRDAEKIASRQHFERLRDGSPQSIETSSIHLDTIRDFKEINALLASLAYPILEENGLLRGSRLTLPK